MRVGLDEQADAVAVRLKGQRAQLALVGGVLEVSPYEQPERVGIPVGRRTHGQPPEFVVAQRSSLAHALEFRGGVVACQGHRLV